MVTYDNEFCARLAVAYCDEVAKADKAVNDAFAGLLVRPKTGRYSDRDSRVESAWVDLTMRGYEVHLELIIMSKVNPEERLWQQVDARRAYRLSTVDIVGQREE